MVAAPQKPRLPPPTSKQKPLVLASCASLHDSNKSGYHLFGDGGLVDPEQVPRNEPPSPHSPTQKERSTFSMMRRQQFRASQTAVRNAKDPSTLINSYDSDLNPSRPFRASPLGSSTIAGLPLELLDRLKAFPLFQSAPDSFLLNIGRSLRLNVYQPRQEIIREGDDAKAMYWLVRGAVRVTSRDGESTYAELKPGAFFGEIGILLDVPRTASVVAGPRSMVVRLNKEDLQNELPQYPDVERAIREEALERLAITERKKREKKGRLEGDRRPALAPQKCSRDSIAGDVEMGEVGAFIEGEVIALAPHKRSRDSIAGDVEAGEVSAFIEGEAVSNKKRKSPSPSVMDLSTTTSSLGSTLLTVRHLLKELPLFTGLPSDILHFLGVNAQSVYFAPFTEILQQGTSGRDVYFIVKGDVEVLTGHSTPQPLASEPNCDGFLPPEQKIRARLKAGQYFGEVTSLSLAPRRTATVRSVGEVECLLITGDVLDELWSRCDANLRLQVENEAKKRLTTTRRHGDVILHDAGSEDGVVRVAGASIEPVSEETREAAHGDVEPNLKQEWRKSLPTVSLDGQSLDGPWTAPSQPHQMEPIDPDPFFNADLDKTRAKSRRSSVAPPVPNSPTDGQSSSLAEHWLSSPSNPRLHSPLKPRSLISDPDPSPPTFTPSPSRRPGLFRHSYPRSKGRLPDAILISIFQHLDLLDLMRLRQVSLHWCDLLTTSPEIVNRLDLSTYNKYVTDDVLRNVIVPFVGGRPKEIDLSNCFHLTDDGFRILVEACGDGARVWRMKSVWDVQGAAILSLVERAKGLEDIDLSNCRKVGDTLLARVIGWVTPDPRPSISPLAQDGASPAFNHDPQRPQTPCTGSNSIDLRPGTVVGASKLKHLTLSYCKHVQDRSMAHIAAHASDRLETLDLTRCTSITDVGFHAWSTCRFRRLHTLILADCTYLSDHAIVGVVGGCRELRHLDLSFCCALSDTATEVLSLGLPLLRSLNMAFCGSAVSDNSLRCIGLHLLELRYLSVRGCVRVTGLGVESVVEGCRALHTFDVSQCKNLRPWLMAGGIDRLRVHGRARECRFQMVADGSWRASPR